MKVEVVKVDSARVQGFAQKGPFIKDASVTVYGLDSSLSRTKTKFSGKVAGDSGAFSVNGIVLGSQYAELEVSGFYRNATTGKNTSGTKTKLTALVDLSEGKSVKANVNLFTEFEKARALELVKKEKYNVPAAKMRASREIVNVFSKTYGGKSVDSASVPSATGMSLADTGAVGSALYAAGVMMTLNRSVSKSASLIGDVTDDIAADGSWDSDTTRASVADNLCTQDSADGFAAIRTNLKNMKLSAAVSNFEANLRYFWNEVYGLGECTEKLESEETVRKVSNKQSDNYGAGFACTSKRWHKVTALDTELGMCTSKMEGQYKESKLAKNTEYYVCKQGTWTKISEVQYNLKECTEEKAKAEKTAYVTVKDSFFVCKDKRWTALTATQYELKDCTKDREDKLTTAGKDEEKFVCENGAWRDATPQEIEFDLCLGATKDIKKSVGGDYYACLEGGWTAIDEAEGVNGFCTKDKKNTLGKDAKGNDAKGNDAYVCEEKDGSFAWRDATAQEAEFGLCLTAGGDPKKSTDGKYYACLEKGWTEVSDNDGLNGLCTEDKKFSLGKDADGKSLLCDGKNWREATDIESSLGACDKEGKVAFLEDESVTERTRYLAYTCTSGEWVENKCSKDNFQTILNDEMICGIRTASSEEFFYWRKAHDGELSTKKVCWKSDLKYGGASNAVVNDVQEGYACEITSSSSGNVIAWREATEGEIATGVVCEESIVHSVKTGYTCVKGESGYLWQTASAGEIANYSECYSSYYWDKFQSSYPRIVRGYVCVQSTSEYYDPWVWRETTETEKITQKVCSSSSACSNKSSGAYSACPSGWRLPSLDEAEDLQKNLNGDFSTFVINSNGYDYAGYRQTCGKEYDKGTALHFWTKTVSSTDNREGVKITKSSPSFNISGYSESSALSVRCIRSYKIPSSYK